MYPNRWDIKAKRILNRQLDDDGHRRLLRHLLVQRHHQPPHIQNSRQISTNAPLRQQTYRSFVIRCNCRRRKWFKYKLFILLIYQSSSPSVFSHIFFTSSIWSLCDWFLLSRDLFCWFLKLPSPWPWLKSHNMFAVREWVCEHKNIFGKHPEALKFARASIESASERSYRRIMRLRPWLTFLSS